MRPSCTLHVGPEGLRLEAAGSTETLALDASALDQAEALTDALGSGFEELGLRAGARVDVRLRPPFVQLRTLRDLPPVRQPDLERLVGNQLGRFFRQGSADAVLAVAWSSADDGTRVAQGAIADVALLERLEQAIERAGRRVQRMRVDGSALELLTMAAHRRRARSRVTQICGMVIVAATGWAVAGATYVVDLLADARAVSTALTELRTPLATIDSLERSLGEFAPVAAAFRTRGSDGAWATARLSGLAAALPRDAHLHMMSAERRRMSVQVHAADPVAVVDALSGWWKGPVTLASPEEMQDATSDSTRVLTLILERRR